MSKLRVSVWRGAEAGEYRNYEVRRQESQTVLDVVTFIQRYLDLLECEIVKPVRCP